MSRFPVNHVIRVSVVGEIIAGGAEIGRILLVLGRHLGYNGDLNFFSSESYSGIVFGGNITVLESREDL